MLKTSVVIASYNGSKYIKSELESILNQTKNIDECIIGDDCSLDDSVEIISDFIESNHLNHWRLIENNTNLGLSKNFFNLLKECSGDIVFIADQDDIWEKSKVEDFLKIFEENPEVLCLSSSFGCIDSNGMKIDAPAGLTDNLDNEDGRIHYIELETLIGHSMIRGCTMAIRKTLVNNIIKSDLCKYMNSDLLCHDWAISVLACLFGKCAIVHKKLLYYRIHGNNSSLKSLDRKNMKRSLESRINGVDKSISAHKILLNYNNLTKRERKFIISHIEFENRRLKYLKNKSLFDYFVLFLNIRKYKRYHQNFFSGIKVFLGDFIYAHNL